MLTLNIPPACLWSVAVYSLTAWPCVSRMFLLLALHSSMVVLPSYLLMFTHFNTLPGQGPSVESMPQMRGSTDWCNTPHVQSVSQSNSWGWTTTNTLKTGEDSDRALYPSPTPKVPFWPNNSYIPLSHAPLTPFSASPTLILRHWLSHQWSECCM